jgi:type III restriction enzyme
MPPVVIENPIINSPFEEPTSHYRFDENDQITNVIDSGRRPSSYFLPIAAPRKRTQQRTFDNLRSDETKFESTHVNTIRASVRKWRKLGWPDVTPVRQPSLCFLPFSAAELLTSYA